MSSAPDIATTASRRPLPRSDERDTLDTIRLSSPADARSHLEALRTATAEHIAGSTSKARKRRRAVVVGACEFLRSMCPEHRRTHVPERLQRRRPLVVVGTGRHHRL